MADKKIRDPLDRYYTPESTAIHILKNLDLDAKVFLEPSVGGGAFAKAIRCLFPQAHILGVDLDPDALGLSCCDQQYNQDLLTCDSDLFKDVEAIVGNPPFALALSHIKWLRKNVPQASLHFLLPIQFLASKTRVGWYMEDPPHKVRILSQRIAFTGPTLKGKGTSSQDYAILSWGLGRAEQTVCSWIFPEGLHEEEDPGLLAHLQ